MLTRFISDSAWGAPEYVYPYDSTVSLKNTKLFVAGNMNVNSVPFLDGVQDISNNNYSIFYLTNKKKMEDIAGIDQGSFLINNEKNYPALLGVFASNGLVREESRFLKCNSLFEFNNDFTIDFRTIRNTYTDLSGATLVFSSVEPVLPRFELGFSINGDDPVYNTDIPIKATTAATENIRTTARNLTSIIDGYSFSKFLSGDIREFSQNQVFKITVSATQSLFNPLTLEGCSIFLSNPILNLNNESVYYVVFQVNGRRVIPEDATPDNFFAVPGNITASTPLTTIVINLTSIFDLNNTPKYPISDFFGITDVQQSNRGFEITLFNRLSGETSTPPSIVNLLGTTSNFLSAAVLQSGEDAKMFLQFTKLPNKTETPIQIPEIYSFSNTKTYLSGFSNFFLNILNFDIFESFEPKFVQILGSDNRILLDFNKINEKHIIISHTLKDKKVFLVSDDLQKQLYFVDDTFVNETNIAIGKFNYIYDPERRTLLLYRIIEGKLFALSNIGDRLQYTEITSLNQITRNCIFDVYEYNDPSLNFNAQYWGSYVRSENLSNISLDSNRSIPIQNNFLFHTEYNNSLSALSINFLPLKNQINIYNEQNRNNGGVDFRDYHSLYTGDNREDGSYNLNLGFTSSTKQYVFKAGHITWFHIPYNRSYSRININDSNLVENGAIAGPSPVFSDKIWKKIGDYKYTSNLGNSNKEQTGQWLCSWLSGSEDGSFAVWVDRFYNPDIITEVEAIRITNNNEYIPSYTSKNYLPGITDVRSTMTFEPGVWYAYNHIGRTDAEKVISYIKKDLIQENLTNLVVNDLGEYIFTGKESGSISIQNLKTPVNNFSLAFFAYSDDWNKPFAGQFIGNYLDSGFGIFNYNLLNPLHFYFKDNKLTIFNNKNDSLINVTVPPNIGGSIVGLFRREYYENFHIITDSLNVLEYNLDGTLVDIISGTDIFENPAALRVVYIHNNETTGVILFENLTFCIIDLKTNEFEFFNSPDARDNVILVNYQGIIGNISAYIDPLNTLYIINGRAPLLRSDKLYFIDNFNPRLLQAYNTSTGDLKVYIDSTKIEQEPKPQEIILSYINTNQNISETPFRSFDLAGLSGANITLFTPTPDVFGNSRYDIGFSIYKDDPIFYNVNALSLAQNTPFALKIDLDGNYWSEYSIIQRPNPLFSRKTFGKKSYFSENNLFFVGDPTYSELVGGSTQNFGRVFVYSLINGQIKYICPIVRGLTPGLTRITFRSDVPRGTRTDFFALSSNLVLFNGIGVYDSAFGATDARKAAISGITIGFRLSSTEPVYNVRAPGTPILTNTKIPITLTGQLTSSRTLVTQITAAFNTTEVVIPGITPTPVLSTFFEIQIKEILTDGFTLDFINRFGGPLLFDRSGGVSDATAELNYEQIGFNSLNPNFFGETYILDVVEDGRLGTGQNNEEFGFDISSVPGIDEQTPTTRTDKLLAISSPGWIVSSTFSVGKVNLYRTVGYSHDNIEVPFDAGSRISFFQGVTGEIVSPLTNRTGIRFGHSIATDYTPLIDTELGDHEKLAIGAPSYTTDTTPGSAFLYRVFSPVTFEIGGTANNPLSSIEDITLTGSKANNFGFKVDVNNDVFAVSAPDQTSGTSGGVVFVHTVGATKNIPIKYVITDTKNLSSSNRYRFGHSFKVKNNLIAIASLSSTDAGPGNLIVDVYRRTPSTKNITLITTLTSPFPGNANPLTPYGVSVDINETHVVAGIWGGDETDIGLERGKLTIWFHNNDKFYQVYDKSFVDTTPIQFNFNPLSYFGNSVSLVKDRMATGTFFFYNTGNSVFWAASAIATALTNNTHPVSGYTAKFRSATPNTFDITVTGRLSAAAANSAIVRDVLSNNFELSSYNKFKDVVNFDGQNIIISGNILNFTFDKNEETLLLADYSKIIFYDVLGNYKAETPLEVYNISKSLSASQFSIQTDIVSNNINEYYSFVVFDNSNNIYYSNYDTSSKRSFTKKVGVNNFFFLGNDNTVDPSELAYPTFNKVTRNYFDTTNYNYVLGTIKLKNPIPTLTFKIRLSNRLDFEDSIVLQPSYPTEFLSKGWHHFAIIFDSVNGIYKGYVDSKPIFNYDFSPNKYSFSTILRNNLLVGVAPYFNNVGFNDFYKSRDVSFFAQNIKLQNVKFYNKALSNSEVRFLNYEKEEPNDLKLQLNFGERNFIDTIKRVMRQKISGRKSPFIDIIINDSLITDIETQKYYETKILLELRDVIPPYVKINKIVWVSNKPAREKITQNDINVGNTLTDSGGIE